MGDRSKIEHRRKQTREHVAKMRALEPAGNIACSFCAKREREVKAIFAGRSAAYICDECVTELARELARRQGA